MSRREFIRRLAMGTALMGASTGCDPGQWGIAGGKPNILLVLADQLRSDAIGPYGGAVISTPNLDRMAHEGVVFERALSTHPVCAPYRGMLMTGRYPTHSGIILNLIHASPVQNPDCLATLFARAGYQTGFIGKWHLSAGRFAKDQLHRDFTLPGPDRLGFRHWEAYNIHSRFNRYWYYRDTPHRIVTDRYETDVQTDQAIAFMRNRAEQDSPFFLVVAPHPPHGPLRPDTTPRGYLERVPPGVARSLNVPASIRRKAPPPVTDVEMRCYYAMTQHLDDSVGRLLAFLDGADLSKDTLVVFASDHGAMLDSHGLRGKNVPYREAVRVPLIMRWPGRIPEGKRLDALHSPMDHLPTLCSAAGIDVPEAIDGVSLWGDVVGSESTGRDALLTMNMVSTAAAFTTGGFSPEFRGVDTGRFTYARYLNGREILFDNEADPFQLSNLANLSPSHPELPGLRSRLSELLSTAHDEFLPGTAYADWYDSGRNLLKTALGPVERG